MKEQKEQKKQDDLLSSNYDGIQEYDNDLPRWWVYLLYLTIVFAFVYYGLFLIGVIPSSEKRLADSLAQIEEMKPKQVEKVQLDENTLIAMLSDQAKINFGKEVFIAKCSPCHGANGEGVVGPNLTDDHWIHGGNITDIRNVIEVGVLDKGMLSWKGLITDDEITNVSLYIRSIVGTNPTNPKAPEGEKFINE